MKKGRTIRRIITGILMVILLLLLLRLCGSNGNRSATEVNNDSSVAPSNQAGPTLANSVVPNVPLPPSGEEKPSSNSPDKAVVLTSEAVQTPAKKQSESKKRLPVEARAEVPQGGVATPVTEIPGVHQDAQQTGPNETLGEAFTEPISKMKFILVRGGCYQMGSDHEQIFEGPRHEVCVDDFYLSKHEVTQIQWLTLMGRTQSNFYFKGKSRPAEWINWNEAQEFIRKLNRRSELTFRLPTEAEWEYAARSGGKDERYAGTSDEDSLEDFAWYRANSNGQTRFIGIKKPNGLGLHDMSGNVREWCSDWHGKDYYDNSPRENPQGPDNGDYRVIRGGGWGMPRGIARTTYRDAAKPNQRRNDIGFRLAMSVK